MYDWIIEADLYRLREARRQTESNQERQCLDELIAAKIRTAPTNSARMAMHEREPAVWNRKGV